MRFSRFSRAALGSILVFACASCTGDTDPGPRPQGGSIRIEGEEPGSLDPAHADDPAETRIARHLFRGLVTFDETRGTLQPATSLRFTVSPDARTFEFTLRRDGRFSNGEPVLAESFVRAFERVTAPVESSPVAAMFSDIQGFKERQGGATGHLAGVVAVDEFTLRITLSVPNAEFPSKLTHPAFSPIPSEAAMLARKPSWRESPIGNGPWQLKEPWKHNESIVLEPNAQYTGSDRPNLKEAVFVLLDDVGVSYDQWLAGNLDWTRIPEGEINTVRAQNPGQTLTGVTPHLVYLVAFPGTPPTDVLAFRQALSLAIDRSVIARGRPWNGAADPATGLLPPGIPGYRRPDSDGVGPCGFCRVDSPQAKRLLTESRVRLGGPLDLRFTSIPDQERWVDAVARSLKQNLGIDSRTRPLRPLSFYIDEMHAGRLKGLAAFEVAMTTPSPDELLFPLFHSRAFNQLNLSRYASQEVDRLLEAARARRDNTERFDLYRQAEDKILQDLPIIPLWWLKDIRLARLSKFGGLEMDLFGDPTITTAYLKSSR